MAFGASRRATFHLAKIEIYMFKLNPTCVIMQDYACVNNNNTIILLFYSYILQSIYTKIYIHIYTGLIYII